MTSHSLSQREKYLKRKQAMRRWKIGITLFAVVGLLVGIVCLSRVQKFRISTVTLSGGTLVTQDDISNATKNFLSGNYLWVFPKNNALLYPKSALKKYLADTFKRIDTISLRLEGFKTLDVVITERPLSALWCDGVPSDTSVSCYFMDNLGTVFAPAPQFSGNAYFRYYGLLSTSTTPIGQQYIASTTEFSELNDFISRAKDLSLDPTYLSSGTNGQFTVGLSNGGYIYIDTEESLAETGNNLEALMQTLSASTTFSISNLGYIDLRFGDKLYYKMKNQ